MWQYIPVGMDTRITLRWTDTVAMQSLGCDIERLRKLDSCVPGIMNMDTYDTGAVHPETNTCPGSFRSQFTADRIADSREWHAGWRSQGPQRAG